MATISKTIVPTNAELLQVQADLWRHSLNYLTTFALKCAVELHILTTIHILGGATTLPSLVAALSLPQTKLPFLGRVMRLLVTSGIFTSDESNGDAVEAVYHLNPLSWLLVEGVESEDHTYRKYFVLAVVSQYHAGASMSLADWFPDREIPKMAASSKTIVPTDADLLQAQADLWRHSLYYLTSLALKYAVELHIPTTIHNLGGATTLPSLVDALSLPQTKLPFLGRVMRLLVTSGIFASDGSNGDGAEAVYRLNPLSWLLVEGVESEDHTYQKYFVLGACSRHFVEAGLSLAEWFKKDQATPLPSPFENLHGVPAAHESTKLLDEELDRIVDTT